MLASECACTSAGRARDIRIEPWKARARHYSASKRIPPRRHLCTRIRRPELRSVPIVGWGSTGSPGQLAAAHVAAFKPWAKPQALSRVVEPLPTADMTSCTWEQLPSSGPLGLGTAPYLRVFCEAVYTQHVREKQLSLFSYSS
ncbi:hypothetical protein NDU88_010843 [Pleurodeles waltl]|uniref:Uncharacterized protein n=1 Tax=Pleurodeles waltl TaxID=8319 RepID=A0AAV7PZ70_PLEWA|nr:hypothetical protein NDU88_010843 [Pleurodeles waltl]